jgi:hypothetical protein
MLNMIFRTINYDSSQAPTRSYQSRNEKVR